MHVRFAAAVLSLLAVAPPARAAEEPAAAPPAAQEDAEPATRSELKALAEELRRLKLDVGISDVEYRSFAGMGPAASKVYYAPKGLSIGGYGEVIYRNNLDQNSRGAPGGACATSPGACDFSDILRVVLYTGYRFNDWIVFNSEVEFEHQRQIFVEFAYLDFRFADALQLRVGNLLVPVGITNELHEPVFFNGVERPEVERNIIPTTWNENGVGVHGELAPGLRYKLYGLGGLSVARAAPAPGSWIRNLRTRGGTSGSAAADRSFAETFAGVAALSYDVGPLNVGGSLYRGRAGQAQVVSANDPRGIDADVTIVEAHASVGWRGAQLRVLGVQGQLTDADLVNAKYALTGVNGVGSRVRGAYVDVGYDVLSLLASEHSLVPFLRYELLKLHDQVPAGYARDPRQDVDLVTTGLTYKPIPTVAIKGDWQWRRTAAEANAVTHALNLGAAFVF
jgi:hypothetical protein